MLRIAVAALAVALLPACSPPTPPEEERRPQPQAAAAPVRSTPAQVAEGYKERARDAVEDAGDAAKDEAARIEAATR